MVMVPVLVVMSGALAFSAFSGTATTNVSATAGYLSWEQSITSTYTYEHNTAVANNSASVPQVSTAKTGPNVTDMQLSVSNLAPGNWIVFNITVKNTGSVGLMLSGATITTMELNATGVNTPTNGLVNYSVSKSDFVYGKALNPSTPSSPTSAIGVGYYFAVTEVPSGSIDNGGSTMYQIFLGLGSNSGNAYQESSFMLNVGITVTSDP